MTLADAMQHPLRNIKSAAQIMTDLTAPLVATPSKATCKIPPLALFSPPQLQPRFKDLEMGSTVTSSLSQAFEKATAATRKLCADKYEESCQQLLATHCPSSGCSPLPDLFDRLRCAFQDTYERHLRYWSHELIPAILTRYTPSSHSTSWPAATPQKAKKYSFNYEYVPLFEKYFELKPFPSQADKSLLAKKSGMTYRQIDVWFQNRRSRAKKDGKTLKKLSNHEEPNISLSVLEDLMTEKTIPEHDRVDSIDSDVSEYEWQYDNDEDDMAALTPTYHHNPQQSDLLDAVPPPHAFPSAYPPTCGYDPFPVKEGRVTFPPPVWMRHPAKSIERRPMIDLDELIGCFARMSVRDVSRRRLMKKDPRKSSCFNQIRIPKPRPAANFFVATRPLPAPIPALIRPTTPTQITPFSPLTSLLSDSSPTTRERPTPSKQFYDETLWSHAPSPPSQERPSRRRKMAPLPRRKPAGTNVACQKATPASPEISPSSSSYSTSSRKPSFGSDCSWQSRLSSDSSSASSVVVTPESSPAPMPKNFSSPSIYQDFSDLSGFLSDPSSGRLSPVQGIRLNFPLADDLHVATAKRRLHFTLHTSTQPLDLTNCS